MGTLATRAVVLLPFPFADLSRNKLRPAVILANAGHGDFILCQITSNPYSDSFALPLGEDDFQSGSLHHISFVRPGKLFTANASLFSATPGILTATAHKRIVSAVVHLLRGQHYKLHSHF